jgi:hypothetical protein
LVTLQHNHGDPIRCIRPESKALRRALAKQRKKLRRLLLAAMAMMPPMPVQTPEQTDAQSETH